MTQLKLPPDHDREQLLKKVCKKLGIQTKDIETYEIVKQSIDARKGQIQYIYTVDLKTKHPVNLRSKKDISLIEKKSYQMPEHGDQILRERPVIAGSGPAGLFCAYLLAQRGFCPIVCERGATVKQRKKDVEAFWETGVLNPSSNVQFGEGGLSLIHILKSDKNGFWVSGQIRMLEHAQKMQETTIRTVKSKEGQE